MRRPILIGLLAAAGFGSVLSTTLRAGGTGRAPRAHAVSIKGFAFAPQRVVAAVGDTIVWTNEDFAVHTVTADTLKWDSGDLEARKQYRLVLSAKGSAAYHCELHPTMKALITIQ